MCQDARHELVNILSWVKTWDKSSYPKEPGGSAEASLKAVAPRVRFSWAYRWMMRAVYDPQYMELVARLRAARKAKGYTQADVAELLNQPQSFVSKVETCERRIDAIEAARLCEILGVSLQDIVPSELRRISKKPIVKSSGESNG